MKISSRSSLPLVLAGSAWLALAGNVPLWLAMWRLPELHGWRGGLLAAVMAGMVFRLCVSFLALLNWRGLLRPAMVLLTLITALSTHYMLSYGIIIDTPYSIGTSYIIATPFSIDTSFSSDTSFSRADAPS